MSLEINFLGRGDVPLPRLFGGFMKVLIFLGLFISTLAMADRVTMKSWGEITPTLAAQTLLAKNKERRGLIVSNNGTDAILLQFGSLATSTTKGMTMAVNTSVEFKNVPMDVVSIQARASTGANKVSYIEFE